MYLLSPLTEKLQGRIKLSSLKGWVAIVSFCLKLFLNQVQQGNVLRTAEWKDMIKTDKGGETGGNITSYKTHCSKILSDIAVLLYYALQSFLQSKHCALLIMTNAYCKSYSVTLSFFRIGKSGTNTENLIPFFHLYFNHSLLLYTCFLHEFQAFNEI